MAEEVVIQILSILFYTYLFMEFLIRTRTKKTPSVIHYIFILFVIGSLMLLYLFLTILFGFPSGPINEIIISCPMLHFLTFIFILLDMFFFNEFITGEDFFKQKNKLINSRQY